LDGRHSSAFRASQHAFVSRVTVEVLLVPEGAYSMSCRPFSISELHLYLSQASLLSIFTSFLKSQTTLFPDNFFPDLDLWGSLIVP
jgi:hypothetical protein